MLSPAEILGFSLPVLVAAFVAVHHLRARKRTLALFRDFEERWKSSASLVLEGRIWRAGDKRRAMVALGRDRVAVRAAGTDLDVEVPLALVRAGGVRERPDGTRLIDFSLPGERFYLEVAPGFIDELVDRLSGRR